MKSSLISLSFGITFFSLAAFSQQENKLNLVIYGDPLEKFELKTFIENNSTIEVPQSDTDYHIQLVEPDPNIDYKIVNIEADPDVDYKLTIINPQTREEVKTLDDGFVNELLDKFKKSRNTSND